MVGVLIRMKLRVLRHSLGRGQVVLLAIGGGLGLVCAAATILAAGHDFGDPRVSASLLAAACLVWTLGWPLGPLFTSGGDETLRPEHFTLLPIPARRLAAGLLGAAFVSVPAAVTVIAFAALPVLGARLGAGPFAVAVPAAALHLAFAVALSKVVVGGLGVVLRSRRGRDLGTLLVVLLITFGWTLIIPLQGLALELIDGTAPVFATVVRVLPSGWGVVAVEAAARSDWPLALGALFGLAGLTAALVVAWGALLARRTTTRAWHGGSTGRSPRAPRLRRRGPLATPGGGVLVKELITWSRDSGRSVILLVPVMVGVVNVVPRWVFEDDPSVNPYAGLLLVAVACMSASNIIAADGAAIWQTLVTPGAARFDVRGRQYAWLLIVATLGIGMTVVFTAAAGAAVAPAWPWVLAALPAVLGAGSGVVLLQAVFVPYTAGDPRTNSPLASNAKPTGRTFLVWAAVPPVLGLAAVPALGVVYAGHALDEALLRWAGIPAGILTGALLAWWFGRIAYRRLDECGPEILGVVGKGA